MTELNDFNISQLEFKNLPSDKKLKYIMHGNIYQYQSDFYVNGIFIDKDKNYYLSFLPLKGLSAFPLGSIFEEMKATSENVLQNVIDVKIVLNKKLTGFKQIKDIEILKDLFLKIPDEISGYTGQNKAVLNQLVAVYKDRISGKILYIPHYEIARWYYIRSSSMCRQVLSGNLEGLYYEAKYLDYYKKEAEIIMKHGSSNGDASEIFRFAKDGFANIMFHNFSLDLAANKSKYNEDKNYDTTKIRANFPVYGELNLKTKGFSIDDKSIFIYQFLEEDSSYPFNSLDVYRYGANKKKEKDAVIKKKSPKKSEMGNRIDENTPSSEYENQTTENDVVLDELRKGLEGKRIKYKPMLDPNEENESIAEHMIQVSGIDLELSLSDASKSGDEGLVHTSLINKIIDEDEKFVKRENNLTLFKQMIFKLIDVDSEKNNLGISVNIVQHANLPRKPKEDKSRKQWLLAFLSDVQTPRQYMLAQIIVNGQIFYVIEIEKESEKEKIATHVFHIKNSDIHSSMIYEILKNYVQNNGCWKIKKINRSLEQFYINHVGSVLGIAERLYKRISDAK
jgi:predicted type IV restriction endonuclease